MTPTSAAIFRPRLREKAVVSVIQLPYGSLWGPFVRGERAMLINRSSEALTAPWTRLDREFVS